MAANSSRKLFLVGSTVGRRALGAQGAVRTQGAVLTHAEQRQYLARRTDMDMHQREPENWEFLCFPSPKGHANIRQLSVLGP